MASVNWQLKEKGEQGWQAEGRQGWQGWQEGEPAVATTRATRHP